MRISTKVSVAVVIAIVCVLGSATLLRYADERTMLLEETRRDNAFVGNALRSMWLESDPNTTDRLVSSMLQGLRESENVRVRLRRVSIDPEAPRGLRPVAPIDELGDLRRDREVVFIDTTRAITYVPLNPGSNVALEMVEPLDSVRHFLDASLRASLLSALVLALIGTVATTLAVRWLVQRPMDVLTVGARRLAQGDLTARVPVDRADEIGDFARDMNRMAQNLEEARSKLAEESAARVATLEALRHADRLRTVGQLASALAHELGTPLNVVMGRARMIQQSSGVDADASDGARIIGEQTARMAKLIRQLLGFARTRGPERRTEDLRALAKETSEMLAPIAKRTQVTLVLDLPSTPCNAEVDRNQVLQAVTNLVMNAIQATQESGEVRIAVSVQARAAQDVGGHPAGQYVIVEVIDRGVGIPAEHREQLFEPFFTTKTSDEGTGLGLPVTYGIVREHGGWIDVQSEVGKGSTFRITLPVRPAYGNE